VCCAVDADFGLGTKVIVTGGRESFSTIAEHYLVLN
jgi:hypothetical protein